MPDKNGRNDPNKREEKDSQNEPSESKAAQLDGHKLGRRVIEQRKAQQCDQKRSRAADREAELSPHQTAQKGFRMQRGVRPRFRGLHRAIEADESARAKERVDRSSERKTRPLGITAQEHPDRERWDGHGHLPFLLGSLSRRFIGKWAEKHSAAARRKQFILQFLRSIFFK